MIATAPSSTLSSRSFICLPFIFFFIADDIISIRIGYIVFHNMLLSPVSLYFFWAASYVSRSSFCSSTVFCFSILYVLYILIYLTLLFLRAKKKGIYLLSIFP